MWRPLLEGEEAAAALRLVQDIGRKVVAAGEAGGRDPRLAVGGGGAILLLRELARDSVGDGVLGADPGELAWALLSSSIERVGELTLPAALYEGFTGVAWLVEVLSDDAESVDPPSTDTGPEPEDEDLNEGVDLALLGSLDGPVQPAEHELLRGLAGFGLYALERGARPTARLLLDRVIDRLAESSRPHAAGRIWPSDVTGARADHYHLGMAHGQAGVVGFLASVLEVPDLDPGLIGRSRRLLDLAVGPLLAHRLAPDGPSLFPSVIVEGHEPIPSPPGWCHGDAGMAVALLRAARAAGRADWEAVGRQAARRAAEVSPDDPRAVEVRDTCLCHGAAGLGHLFHRLYQLTQESALADAARAWYRLALDRGRSGDLETWAPRSDDRGGNPFRHDQSLLLGTTGTALCLLAATGRREPTWDRLLLLSSVV